MPPLINLIAVVGSMKAGGLGVGDVLRALGRLVVHHILGFTRPNATAFDRSPLRRVVVRAEA